MNNLTEKERKSVEKATKWNNKTNQEKYKVLRKKLYYLKAGEKRREIEEKINCLCGC